MDVRVALLAVTLAGCAMLSGLDDKTADLDDGIGSPNRPSSSSSTSTSSGSSSSSGDVTDGAVSIDDAATDVSDGAATTPGNRNITFEDGKLVHPSTGFDSTAGATQLLSANAIGGTYSMLVDGAGVYGTVFFAPVTDLYLAVRFRLDANSVSGNGDAHVLRVTHAGGLPIEILIKASPRDLSILQGATSLGGFANLKTDGTVYRLQMAIKSAGSVNARLVGGGATVTAGGGATIGASSKLEVGAVSGGAIRVTFDDIAFDSAIQP